ncbi:hypothetical protein GCM10007231_07130 [Nocardioides daphniae]|uniref:Uncharacterized protein n=1 Tax=Nocardioides daphniae TaxID=402297 RepID=A0ABQ1Q2C2_9ACTN|nr:hypothetical protein GCM10007231_07130 [Nocardioides daphniae]
MLQASSCWFPGRGKLRGLRPDTVDTARLQTLIERPEASQSNLDAAAARMDLVRDDLQLSGTGAVRRFPTVI